MKSLEERAWPKLRRLQFGCDGVVIEVGGLLGETLLETEEFLESIIEPNARGCSAKEVVVAREDSPDFARVLDFRAADFQLLHRDALAIEHPVDVVIGLDKQFGGIGKRLVPRKPCGLCVPMRADDWQRSNVCVKGAGNGSRGRLGRKKAVVVDQHGTLVPFGRARFSPGSGGQTTTSIHICQHPV